MSVYNCNVCGRDIYFNEHFDERFEGEVNLVEKVKSKTGALSTSELNYTVCSHCFNEIDSLIRELVEERSKNKKDDEDILYIHPDLTSETGWTVSRDFGVNEND